MKNHLQNSNVLRKSTKFSITETSFSSSCWSNFFSVSFETVNHFSFARRKAAKVPWNNLKMKKEPSDVFYRKKIPQNSQENTCARVSFLMKFQVSGLHLFSKRDSGTGVFLWILRNFEEHLFYRNLRKTASENECEKEVYKIHPSIKH